jgi:hypothetical protein
MIRKILEDFASNFFCVRGIGLVTYKKEETQTYKLISQAEAEIKKYFLEMLPKALKPIRVKVGNLKLNKVDSFSAGYNACLSEIKAKLEE